MKQKTMSAAKDIKFLWKNSCQVIYVRLKQLIRSFINSKSFQPLSSGLAMSKALFFTMFTLHTKIWLKTKHRYKTSVLLANLSALVLHTCIPRRGFIQSSIRNGQNRKWSLWALYCNHWKQCAISVSPISFRNF